MRFRRILPVAALIVPITTATMSLQAVDSAQAAAPAAAAGAQAPLTPAQAAALSTNVTDRVIIVFKDQESNLPDNTTNGPSRAAAESQVQAPVMKELAQTHATGVESIQLVNSIIATVSPGEAQRLTKNPSVSYVVKDAPIPLQNSISVPRPAAASAGVTPLAGACGADGAVELAPEAVSVIHAATQSGTGPAAQNLGYTGAGVKVAFIADGLNINDPDFIRANGQHVFVDYQDFSGTGTDAPTNGGEAFLDASSIAAQGRETYNVQNYGIGLDEPCNIRILGAAPGASLVGLNVFGSSNFAFNSVFLEAINYAVNVDHVNVINESFGGNSFPDAENLDLTVQADNAAVAAGVTVVSSSGDAGVTNTEGSPATDPLVISAGASTTYQAYAQTGIGGITYPTVKGWLDNNISGLSSGGFDQAGGTVDVVAPGDLNWALCSPQPKLYSACTNFAGQAASVELSGGTSEASPLTAGVAALVIQAYEESHGGAAPSPAVVKQIIVSTAEDISAPAQQQGAGLLDAYAAVQAAASYPGGTRSTGNALIKSSTQFNAVAPVSTKETFTNTVTNTGASAQTVAVSTRTLGAYKTITSTSVDLQDATGDSGTVQFAVPAGAARLNADIAYVGNGSLADDYGGEVNLSLISPSGKLAAYNLPQGNGNYGNAEVADPQAGTWTALISSSPSTEGGTTGNVKFGAQYADWTTFGHVAPASLSLAAGQSKNVTLTVSTPARPGDEAGAVVLTSTATQPSFAATTTVPVTLRSLMATPAPSTTFTGTLTGGNGRDLSTGVTEYYQFNLPAGAKELNAEVSTANPANTFQAYLIDPVTDEAASTAFSTIPGTDAAGVTQVAEPGAQLHVLQPDAGIWTLAIDFYNQVAGTALSQPFTVTLDRTLVPATSTLPDSASTNLTKGQATTVYVRVKNTGTTPEAYFVDARLDGSEQVNLAALTVSSLLVPIQSAVVPEYLVPTHTTSITATATSPSPAYFDIEPEYGDPDLVSTSQPDSGTATVDYSNSPVTDTDWTFTPFLNGPDGKTGDTPVTVQTAMTATTAPFDPTVSSPVGDLWQESVNSNASFDPYVVMAGQTVTIPVTIAPTAAAGTTVQGTLYVDDVSSLNGQFTYQETQIISNQGNDLAALPYEYTVSSS